MEDRQRKKRTRLKMLWVLEVIVCYLALLTIVSYIRGPQRYETISDLSLIETSGFITLDGIPEESGNLKLTNPQPGAAVGYAVPIELAGLDGINVQFRIECPAECAGGILLVDLFNQERGYDNVEQEYSYTLLPGTNLVNVSLTPGNNAPEQAFLRIFTGAIANYSIEDLQVNREIPLPKVTPAMAVVFVGSLLILLGTTVLIRKDWVQER